MKSIKSIQSFFVFAFTVAIFIASCEKDKMVPPTIDFLTTAGYTSADGHLAFSVDLHA